MEKKEIKGVLEGFHFWDKTREERVKFVEYIFRIKIDESEILFSQDQLIDLIQIRLIQTEACPECDGFGCKICRGTGKVNIYK